MQIEQRTNQSHGLVRPDCHSLASSVDDCCCSDCREQNETNSGDPRQSYTDFGHPVAIEVAVSDGVDNLEVALQGDDHETHHSSGHADAGQGWRLQQNTDNAVGQVASAPIVHEAAGWKENKVDQDEETRQEIHEWLVNDQRVDVAARLSTSPYQNRENHRVGYDANAGSWVTDGREDLVYQWRYLRNPKGNPLRIVAAGGVVLLLHSLGGIVHNRPQSPIHIVLIIWPNFTTVNDRLWLNS